MVIGPVGPATLPHSPAFFYGVVRDFPLRNSPNVQMAPLSLVAHRYRSSTFGGIPILGRRARPAAARAGVSSELAARAAVQNPGGGADHHGSSDHPLWRRRDCTARPLIIGRSLIRVEAETAPMQEFPYFTCSAARRTFQQKPRRPISIPKNDLNASIGHSSQSTLIKYFPTTAAVSAGSARIAPGELAAVAAGTTSTFSPADLHQHVGAGDDQPAGPERPGQRRRQHQAQPASGR